MLKMDKQVLRDMIVDYGPEHVMQCLRDVINERASELVDMEMKDDAKHLSLAAHHLTIFVGE